MGGGGGGSDNSYAIQQQNSDNRKAAARNALNAAFGIAPTVAPSQADFQQPQKGDGGWLGSLNPFNNSFEDYWNPIESDFLDPGLNYLYGDKSTKYEADPTSYGSAQSSYQKAISDAATNKTARDSLYQSIRDNAFTAGKRGFDERKTDANRNNKFALFAQGLNGGSVDVDENALLDRTYNQGLLDLGAKADAAKTDVKNSDEQSRLQLLQSIDSGTDQGSVLTSALNQLKNNSDAASANAQGTSVGDLFANSGLLYTKSNAARGASDAASYFSSLFPRTAGTKQSSNQNGIISNVGIP